MHDTCRAALQLDRRLWTALVGLACLAAPGCAPTLARGWADFKADKAMETAVADDSFPSAAEVGLASTDRREHSDR
jgi:hypothetical protein